MTIHETMLSTLAEICAELAARGGYTGAAVASLTEQVCWENLFHEIRDRAEPVYAFDANGLLSAALKYRGRKLFDSNATLLWRELTHAEEDDGLDTTRYLEMWLLEDMSFALVHNVSMVIKSGDFYYATEYRSIVKLLKERDDLFFTPESLTEELEEMCIPQWENEATIYEL